MGRPRGQRERGGNVGRGRRRRYPKGGTCRNCLCVCVWGGGVYPLEENKDFPEFPPERAHLLLQGLYGDLPHHNDGSHLDRGVMDDDVWQRRWRRLAVQSNI